MTDTQPRSAAELTPAEVQSVVEYARRVKAREIHAIEVECLRDGRLSIIPKSVRVTPDDLENPHT